MKTRETAHAGFVLDLARCVGCGACVLACRIENTLPPGIAWRRVVPFNLSRRAAGPTYFLSVACHHCAEPPCVKGCPSGALHKRSDGVVLLDSDLCLGCRYCEMACPFGAPAYDAGSGTMTKCHLCHDRLAMGLDPACVAACPTGALDMVRSERRGEDGADATAAAVADRTTKTPIPGLGDPAGAKPNLHVRLPGGRIRAARFADIEARLHRRTTGDP